MNNSKEGVGSGWTLSFQSTETFLNVHLFLTECSLNATEWQAHFNYNLVIFFQFSGKSSIQIFHQIWGFKVKSLWITTHEINEKKPPGILNFIVPVPVRYPYTTLLHIGSGLIWILLSIYFLSVWTYSFFVLNVCTFLFNYFRIDVMLMDSFLCIQHVGFNVNDQYS